MVEPVAKKVSIADYKLGKVVGEGAYGKVMLSRQLESN